MKIRTFPFIVLILIPVSVFFIFYLEYRGSKNPFEEMEKLFKVLALYSAFWFLLYKYITGWLVINLKVTLGSSRANKDALRDHLTVTVNLDKGNVDSVWIKDIFLKISCLDPEGNEVDVKTISPVGYRRSKIEVIGNNVNWSDGREGRMLNVAPGESTSFSAYTDVVKGHVVTIEATILGTRPLYGLESSDKVFIQWKASTVVLPVV